MELAKFGGGSWEELKNEELGIENLEGLVS